MCSRPYATGELVAALGGSAYTDLPPYSRGWSDLAGELRLTADTWDPDEPLGVHIEVSSGRTTLCGRLRVTIPPPGERRRHAFHFEQISLP